MTIITIVLEEVAEKDLSMNHFLIISILVLTLVTYSHIILFPAS